MASPVEDDIFEKLKNKSEADTAEQQRLQAEQQQRRLTHAQKEQQRLAELLEDNSSLPVNISSVRILHANRTRHGFLERVVNPILSANREQSYTLDEALREVETATDKLNRFGIFKSPGPHQCRLVAQRPRRLHLGPRARQLHHQDGHRGRRLRGRRLRQC
jgi:outer membrane protein insertion porin family